MEKRFFEVLREFNFKGNTGILLAVSGGKDSISMLDLFYKAKDFFKFKIVVCHYNHSLRDEADFDENFVKTFSEKLGLKFYSKKEDVNKFSIENKLSTEEAARILRYRFFDEVLKKEELDFIATAHNKDDLAETVIMRILRGTGIEGLVGIQKKRDNIIRPIIDFSRDEIEKYILENNLSFVQDKTNFLDIYNRNKIRLNLFPRLKEEYNSNIIDALCRLSNIADDYSNVAREYINSKENILWEYKKNKIIIKIDEIKKESKSFRSILFRNFFEKISKNPDGINYRLIEEIDKLIFSKTGKYVRVKNIIFKNEYNNLVIFNDDNDKIEIDKYYFENLKKSLYSTNIFDIIIERSNFEEFNREKKNHNLFFINEKFLNNLKIRNRKNGDFLNLKFGKKKIKDLFIDEKVSKDIRDSIPVFEINSEIVWVSNLRRSDTYLVDDSKDIIKIKVIQKEIV